MADQVEAAGAEALCLKRRAKPDDELANVACDGLCRRDGFREPATNLDQFGGPDRSNRFRDVARTTGECRMARTAQINRQYIFLARPKGLPDRSHFELLEGAVREPLDGEVLVVTRCLSVDPTNRMWMMLFGPNKIGKLLLKVSD
jgi:hypothetical protein